MGSRVGRAAVVALAVATLALAVGCSQGPPKDNASEVLGASTDDGTRPAYRAKFVVGRCPFDTSAAKFKSSFQIDCGTVKLPEDRADPNGDQVTLAVAIIRSKNPDKKPDPLVYLAGGPGGSSVVDVQSWVDPASPVLEDRDVILLDQRGTGYSEPSFWCARETESIVRTATMSEEDFNITVADKCADRLDRAGVDLTAYTTEAAAHDVADVRNALGVGDWNLLGVSYGTRLALRVMNDHPAGLRSVVIDSVYPPGVSLGEEWVPNHVQLVKDLTARCNQDPGCAGRFPNLEQSLASAVERFNRNPVRYEDWDDSKGRWVEQEFTGDMYIRTLFSAMYSSSVIPVVPRSISYAAAGDLPSAVNALRPVRPVERPKGEPPPSRRGPTVADGLYLAIECAEDYGLTNKNEVTLSSEGQPPALAEPWAKVANNFIDQCDVWPHEKVPNPVTTSDTPTLVMAGTLDPITPPRWALKAKETLANSQYIEIDGGGHGVSFDGGCPTDKMRAFLNDPTAPLEPCPSTFSFK